MVPNSLSIAPAAAAPSVNQSNQPDIETQNHRMYTNPTMCIALYWVHAVIAKTLLFMNDL